MIKAVLKGFIPIQVRCFVKRELLMYRHASVLRQLKNIFDKNDDLLKRYNITAKKKFPAGTRIIWQYWGQGFEENKVPGLVKICLRSVETYASDFHIVRLTDQNISDYVFLPDFIQKKRDQFGIAHFSDLLRTILLAVYGGLWLDACTLLTGDLPKYLFKEEFFVDRRDLTEKHKTYWENSFIYYWGWKKRFKVRVLVGIMFAQRDSSVIRDISNIMLRLWERFDSMPDYFAFSIIIGEYFKRHPQKEISLVSDTIPHILRQHINGMYLYQSVKETLDLTTIHSLNYKNEFAEGHLRKLLLIYRPNLIN